MSTNYSDLKPNIPDNEEYKLIWHDEFDGNELDRSIWNVEFHEPGWVNEELQEYVDSPENIKVENSTLILQPVKKGDKYTSGRVNCQGKKDLLYGVFEVSAKVPTGKGYLPAFWMMPTNENLYGQWPRCGEIDCMEVMGHETNKLYGTIHYGNPHAQQQGEKTVESAHDFATEEHIYTCEWEPGKITWYLDGVQYYSTSEWHTTTEGQGTVTYPAPFDQPFYVILNLAVGGSWVGYPDETTSFENQAFEIDYVRAYQKNSYDEDVTKPEKIITIKDPDSNGNYITNGDFTTAENLSDNKDWKFMTAQGGEASASIDNKEMKITTTNAGTVDYSVQLVQAGLPLEKNDTYEISFKAKSDAVRSTNVTLKAPDLNYATYWSEDIELGTEYKDFKFTYKMNKATDAKTVRADGNYLYNGSFQEGDKILENWIIGEGIVAEVTPLSDNRRLKAEVSGVNATISQTDTPLGPGKYDLSFEAEGVADSSVDITIGGVTKTISLSADKKIYNEKIELPANLTNKDFVIKFKNEGTFYLDNELVKDKCYKLSFDAKSSIDRTIQYAIQRNGAVFNIALGGGNNTTSKSLNGLKASKKYYVRIRTYKTVSKVKYTSKWSKVVTATTKK